MNDWRDHLTDDERDIRNRWSMYGSDCLVKVGRKWSSTVPKAPLFATKREANDYLTRFVCDVLPAKCRDRAAS